MICAIITTALGASELPIKDGQKIAFMGDSITEGGANDPSGYVNLVIRGLEANGIKATAIPAGISGHRATQMLRRLDRDVLNKADWMTLSCGVNDVGFRDKGVPLALFKESVAKIIDQCQAAGVQVMVLTATMTGEDQANPTNQKLIGYNEILRALAREKHCLLADLNTDMQTAVKIAGAAAKGRALTCDGVHMNAAGNRMMATGVLKAFGLSTAQIARAEKSWVDVGVHDSGALLGATRFVAAADGPAVTIESLLGEMIDRDALARWPVAAYTCKQASSYDRARTGPDDPKTWFSNRDYDYFIRIEEKAGRKEYVIMDETGPGCITRWWIPLEQYESINHRVRIYLDGKDKPAIDAKYYPLLSGLDFVKPPLAFIASDEKDAPSQIGLPPGQKQMAADLYLPIPFARGCKITLDRLPFYYNINYRKYNPGTAVKSFTMADYVAASAALHQVAHALNNPENATGGSESVTEGTVEPGAELAIDLPIGARAASTLRIQIDPRDAPQVLRSAVVEAAFDGQPVVWCPLGEFFGCGARLNAVQDWCRSVEKDGNLFSRWVMPYERTGRIAIKNHGKKGVHLKLAAWTSAWRWDDRSLHFHANWHCQYPLRTRPMSDWNYIQIQGRGVYLGDTLTVFNPVAAWYGEGDEKIYVDGEKFPSHIGTGTEDYYGYAWGMSHHFNSPFISMPLRESKGKTDWKGYTTTSRLRLLDGIPLRSSLKMDMEIWHWADTKVRYAVGTFWYARPGATSNRSPAADELLQNLPP